MQEPDFCYYAHYIHRIHAPHTPSSSTPHRSTWSMMAFNTVKPRSVGSLGFFFSLSSFADLSEKEDKCSRWNMLVRGLDFSIRTGYGGACDAILMLSSAQSSSACTHTIVWDKHTHVHSDWMHLLIRPVWAYLLWYIYVFPPTNLLNGEGVFFYLTQDGGTTGYEIVGTSVSVNLNAIASD